MPGTGPFVSMWCLIELTPTKEPTIVLLDGHNIKPTPNDIIITLTD